MKFSVMLVEKDRSKQCFHVKSDAAKLLVQLGETGLSLQRRKMHHIHDNTRLLGLLSILTLDNNPTFGVAADGPAFAARSNVTSMGLS